MIRRIAIVGSRPPDFKEPVETHAAYARLLSRMRQDVEEFVKLGVIVSGDAIGLDRAAQEHAEGLGHIVIKVPVSSAAWRRGGKRIAAVRNQIVVDISDDVYAYWFNRSPGTRITIEMARAAGKLRNVVEAQ